MVVVQVIRTRWTKASRGAPGSTRRAAVPAAVAIPDDVVGAGGGLGLVHEVDAVEDDDFELRWRGVAIGDRFPLRAGGLRVDDGGDALVVTRLPDRWNGWPTRERNRLAFRLRPGEWGRAVRNNRHGSWAGWTYTRTVVNVASAAALDRDLFLGDGPAKVLDEEALLR